MANLGPNDLKQFGLPTYWDAATLEKFRLIDGTNIAAFVADVTSAMGMQMSDMMAEPLYSGLISTTEELALEYGVGVSNGFTPHTEYSLPDAKRGATTGHMLPLIGYDRMLAWTWDMLRKARRSQLDEDIASAIADLKDIWEQKILTRLFKSTYDAVGSGRSMPLADGGTADAAYIPKPRPDRGGTFLYTHDHISNLNGITQANLLTAVKNLWEHGTDGPYDLLIAQADIASWTATATVTGWTPRADPLVTYGTTQSLSQAGGDYLGVITTEYGVVRVRATGRVPTTYWSLYKSYGPMDARNPLIVRKPVGSELGPILLPSGTARQFPIEDCVVFFEFGVGVKDRVGATVYINSAGGYSDPTIS